MTPPRETVAVRFVRRIRCRRTSSCPSAAPCRQLAAAATRLRQPLNGRPTSILIAAINDLPVVMRMTVSDADAPAAAKRARWAQNSARRHRLRALGDCSDSHPDVFVVLACVRLRGLAPAPVEQDGDGPTFVTG